MIGLLYFSSGQDGWYFQKLYKLRLLTSRMKGTGYKFIFLSKRQFLFPPLSLVLKEKYNTL
jgi:hypothetical protein